MNPKLLSVDQSEPRESARFQLREFGRVLALTARYRALLALGLLSTIIFAALHTVSIAGAFPVFKMLLEDEGLRGWAYRHVAGERLGMELVAVEAGEFAVQRVAAGGPAAAAQVRVGDIILVAAADREGTDALSVSDRLRDIATTPVETRISIAHRPHDGAVRNVELLPERLRIRERVLLTAASYLPADADTPAGKLRVLTQILVGLCCLVLVSGVFRYAADVLIAHAVFRSMLDLRAQLYDKTLCLPLSYFAGHSTADTVTRFVQDIQEIQRGLMTFFGKFVREPLRAVLILCLAFLLDWRIMLTMVFVAPITVIVFWIVGRKVKNANRRLLRGYGRMIDALTVSLHNLRVVKAYTAEAYEQKRLTHVDRGMFHEQLKLARLQAFVSPMIEALAVLAGSVATVWLAEQVLQHDLEIATFLTLGATLAMLFDPLRRLTDVYVRVKRSTAGAERVFQIIDEPTERDAQTGTRRVGPLQTAIAFENVTFTYPGAEQPALDGVTLQISCGETVAIVGPNGCGKTTLVSMILRLLACDSGGVLYDGVDVCSVDLTSLREQISLVSQETIIFAGTPIENIAYGRQVDDRAAVEDAAKRAFADEFISNLPAGYDTIIGERGTTLSGGQRQRLAIARAIYRDAPILIFDEATSQVDSDSERKIQQAVREFCVGRTTIIIAHRLSTIQFADRIVVMDAGKIVDAGTHDELLPRCDLYRTLCSTQFVHFDIDPVKQPQPS